MGGDPAPQAVGDDAEHLVEEKEKGDLQGAETLIVEVQDHQHVDGPVRQGKAPIGAGNDQIGAQGGIHGYSIRASLRVISIMRFT